MLHAYQMGYSGTNEVIFLNYSVHINSYLARFILAISLICLNITSRASVAFDTKVLYPCFELPWQEVCVFNADSFCLLSG